MKHFTRLATSAGIVALALAGCGGGGTSGGSGKAQDAASFKACAVSDAGGWNDKSFNESAYNGLKETQSKPGIQRPSPAPTRTLRPTLSPWSLTAVT